MLWMPWRMQHFPTSKRRHKKARWMDLQRALQQHCSSAAEAEAEAWEAARPAAMVVMMVMMFWAAMVAHGAPAHDRPAIAVTPHNGALTVNGRAADAARMRVTAARVAVVMAAVTSLRDRRSHHCKAGGNGQKGEDLFHGELGFVCVVFLPSERAASSNSTQHFGVVFRYSRFTRFHDAGPMLSSGSVLWLSSPHLLGTSSGFVSENLLAL